MTQKIEVVYCPSCGAPVKFLEGREDTFCTSCGHQLFREDTHLEMKLKHEEVKMKHEEIMTEQKRLDDDQKFGIIFTSIGWIIILIIGIIVAINSIH